MSKETTQRKIVVFTGAGVSAESGLKTFRDSDGLWNNYHISDVATYSAWQRNPALVLDFYNQRRRGVVEARPNAAHLAIAELERQYDVVVITQNIDDLHERAGSSNVIHLHGEITKARSTANENLVIDIGGADINLGDLGEDFAQLRPHIVWFGEPIFNYEISQDHIASADKILVVGTSLTVQPAAGMLREARHDAEKVIVAFDVEAVPYGYTLMKGSATSLVPSLVNAWLNHQKAT